jgi:cytochrome c2
MTIGDIQTGSGSRNDAQTGEVAMKAFLIAVLSIAASTGETLAQDLAAGKASFRKCAPCHSVGKYCRGR